MSPSKIWTNDQYARLKPKAFHSAMPDGEPMRHQLKALTTIEYTAKVGRLKGYLLCDDAGMGKSLTAALAVVRAKEAGAFRRPTIIVAPEHLCWIWKSEFEKWFKKDSLRIAYAEHSTAARINLLDYDIVITSYKTVEAQMFFGTDDTPAEYCVWQQDQAGPNRPRRGLFQEIKHLDEVTTDIGAYLVLDEAHLIRPESPLHQAVGLLRHYYKAVLGLSGTVIDRHWTELYAFLSLLHDQPLVSMEHFRVGFTRPGKDPTKDIPSGSSLKLLQQFLNAYMMRRPVSVGFPRLHGLTSERVLFQLDVVELEESNKSMLEYRAELATQKKLYDAGKPTEMSRGLQTLIRSHRMSYHPKLADLPIDQDHVDIQNLFEKTCLATPAAELVPKWIAWKADMIKNGSWKSSRVLAILDQVSRWRTANANFSIVIFDENAFFLDIVEIGLVHGSNGLHQGQIHRHDGLVSVADSSEALISFATAPRPKVLLATYATAGLGVELTSADTIIETGILMRPAVSEQAVKRLHRPGQAHTVHHVQLYAGDECLIEAFKAKKNARKLRFSKIISGVTWPDCDTPPRVLKERTSMQKAVKGACKHPGTATWD